MSSRPTTCIPPDRPRKRSPRSFCHSRCSSSRGHSLTDARGCENSSRGKESEGPLSSCQTLGNGRCHQRPDGALRFARSRFPIKAIVLPFITEDFLGVLLVLRGVFLLRRHQFLANANSR